MNNTENRSVLRWCRLITLASWDIVRLNLLAHLPESGQTSVLCISESEFRVDKYIKRSFVVLKIKYIYCTFKKFLINSMHCTCVNYRHFEFSMKGKRLFFNSVLWREKNATILKLESCLAVHCVCDRVDKIFWNKK